MKSEECLSEFKKYINENKRELKIDGNIINIDLNSILRFNNELYENLVDVNFQDAYKMLNLAIEESLLNNYKIHLINGNTKLINQIRAKDMCKFYALKGIIKRTTKIIPKNNLIKYECLSCGTIISVLQLQRKKKEPSRCSCGGKRFTVSSSEIKNIQEITLEELHEEIGDRQPQQIRVYLENELTDENFNSKLQPGRKVIINGCIELLPAFMTLKDEESNISEFMVYANNIINLDTEDDINITKEDEDRIKEIASKEPLERLANSLSPEIYGNDIIKKAIVLQMVKGLAKERSDGSFTREDIHILLSGDPGISKSIMLESTNKRTPRSRKVIGTKTSAVSLSAMAVRDEMTGTWALEIGSLVLTHNSTLILDEIDKLRKENLSELLEPMSSGFVTVNKAGIYATLPARTSILAAANPVHGNYDLSQPIAKQIDLPSPILNRFDLIFIMIDKPDIDYDNKAITHIFNSYKTKIEPEISVELFKKYVTYCRKLKPILKNELLESISKFYTNLRQRSNKGKEKGLPINLRNIEGVIRLAEANAKIRLSKEVEEEDIKVAKEIFMYSLKQIGIDNELGIIDMSRSFEKTPVTKRGKMEVIRHLLYEIVKTSGEDILYYKVLEKAKEFGIEQLDVDDCLYELNKIGDIISPTKGHYKIVK